MRNPRGRSRHAVSYNPDPHRGYSSGEEMSRYMNRPSSSMSYDGGNPSRNLAQDYHRPYHSDGSRSSTPQGLGMSNAYGHGAYNNGRRKYSTARRNMMHNRPHLQKTESWSSDSSALSSQPPLVTNNFNRLHKSQGDMLNSSQHSAEDPERIVRSADWTPQRPTPRYPGNMGSYSQGGGYHPNPSANNGQYPMQNMGYSGDQGRQGYQNQFPQRNSYNKTNYSQPPPQQHNGYGVGGQNQNENRVNRYHGNQNMKNSGESFNNNNNSRNQRNSDGGQGGSHYHGNHDGQSVRGDSYGNYGQPSVNRWSGLRGYLNLADDDVIQELEVTV